MGKFYVLVESLCCNVCRSQLMVSARRFEHAKSGSSIAEKINDSTKSTKSTICSILQTKQLSTKSSDAEDNRAVLQLRNRTLPIAVINDAQLGNFKLLVVPVDFTRYDEAVMRSAFKACIQNSEKTGANFTQFLTYVNSDGKPQLVQLKDKAFGINKTVVKGELFDRIKDATQKLMIVNDLMRDKFPVKEGGTKLFPNGPKQKNLHDRQESIEDGNCETTYKFYPETSPEDESESKQHRKPTPECMLEEMQPRSRSSRSKRFKSRDDPYYRTRAIGKHYQLAVQHNHLYVGNANRARLVSFFNDRNKMSKNEGPVYYPVDGRTEYGYKSWKPPQDDSNISVGDDFEYFPVEGKTRFENETMSGDYEMPPGPEEPPEEYPVEGKTVYQKGYPTQEIKSTEELKRISSKKRKEAEDGGFQRIRSFSDDAKRKGTRPPAKATTPNKQVKAEKGDAGQRKKSSGDVVKETLGAKTFKREKSSKSRKSNKELEDASQQIRSSTDKMKDATTAKTFESSSPSKTKEDMEMDGSDAQLINDGLKENTTVEIFKTESKADQEVEEAEGGATKKIISPSDKVKKTTNAETFKLKSRSKPTKADKQVKVTGKDRTESVERVYQPMYKTIQEKAKPAPAKSNKRISDAITFDEEEEDGGQSQKELEEVRKYLTEPPKDKSFEIEIFSKLARQKRAAQMKMYTAKSRKPSFVEFVQKDKLNNTEEYIQSKPELFTTPGLKDMQKKKVEFHAEEEDLKTKETDNEKAELKEEEQEAVLEAKDDDSSYDKYKSEPMPVRNRFGKRPGGARTIMPTSRAKPGKSLKDSLFTKGTGFHKDNSRTNASIASARGGGTSNFMSHQQREFLKVMNNEVSERNELQELNELDEINEMNGKQPYIKGKRHATEDDVCKQMAESAEVLEKEEQDLQSYINKQSKAPQMHFDARVVLKLTKPISGSGLKEETQQLVKAATEVIYTPSTVKALKKLGFIIDALVVQNQVWGMKKLENSQEKPQLDVAGREHAITEGVVGAHEKRKAMVATAAEPDELTPAEKRNILKSPKISNIVFPLYQKERSTTSSAAPAPLKTVKKVLYGSEGKATSSDDKTWSNVGKVLYETERPDKSDHSVHIFKHHDVEGVTKRENAEQLATKQNSLEKNAAEDGAKSVVQESQTEDAPVYTSDIDQTNEMVQNYFNTLTLQAKGKRPLPLSVRRPRMPPKQETSRDVQAVTATDEDPWSLLTANVNALHRAIAATESEVETFLKEQESKAEALMEEWRKDFLEQMEDTKDLEEPPVKPKLPQKPIKLHIHKIDHQEIKKLMQKKQRETLNNYRLEQQKGTARLHSELSKAQLEAAEAANASKTEAAEDDDGVHINIYERVRWQDHKDSLQAAAEEQKHRQDMLEREIAARLSAAVNNQLSQPKKDGTEKLEESIRKYKRDSDEPKSEQDVISKTTINHVDAVGDELADKDEGAVNAHEAALPEQRQLQNDRKKMEKLHQRQVALEKILMKAEAQGKKQLLDEEREQYTEIPSFKDRVNEAKEATKKLIEKREQQEQAAKMVQEKADDDLYWDEYVFEDIAEDLTAQTELKDISQQLQPQTQVDSAEEQVEYADVEDEFTTETVADTQAQIEPEAAEETEDNAQSSAPAKPVSIAKNRNIITVLLRKPQVSTKPDQRHTVALKMTLPKKFAQTTPAKRKVIITNIINKALFGINKEKQQQEYLENPVNAPKFDENKMKKAFQTALDSPEQALELQNELQRRVNKIVATKKIAKMIDNISISPENGGTMIIKSKFPMAAGNRKINMQPTLLRAEHINLIQTILELNLDVFNQHVKANSLIAEPAVTIKEDQQQQNNEQQQQQQQKFEVKKEQKQEEKRPVQLKQQRVQAKQQQAEVNQQQSPITNTVKKD